MSLQVEDGIVNQGLGSQVCTSSNGSNGAGLVKISTVGEGDPMDLDDNDPFGPNGSFNGFSRHEVTRALIQTLRDIGHADVASNLAQKSKCQLEVSLVSELHQSIMSGDWEHAEKTLIHNSTFDCPVSNGALPLLRPDINREYLCFQVKQQKYREMLISGRRGEALLVLREDLTRLSPEYFESVTEELAKLTEILMTPVDDPASLASIKMAVQESRRSLWDLVTECLSYEARLPPNRLGSALDDMMQLQLSQCLYHTSPLQRTLLYNHSCEQSKFPDVIAASFRPFTSEPPNNIEFSHSGKLLVVGGDAGGVVVYDTETMMRMELSINLHNWYISGLSFSPDDRYLVTTSLDRTCRLINLEDYQPSDPINFEFDATNCLWHPNGKTFFVSSMQKNGGITEFDLDCKIVRKFDIDRITTMVMIPNENRFVLLNYTGELVIFDFVESKIIKKFPELASLKPKDIAIHPKGRLLFINTQSDGLLIYDMVTEQEVAQTVSQQTDVEDVVRVTCGGANNTHVIVGSPGGLLYIRQASTGRLVTTLKGHDGKHVSKGLFNPANPRMLATCGDNCQLNIWLDKASAPAYKAKVRPALKTESPLVKVTNGHRS